MKASEMVTDGLKRIVAALQMGTFDRNELEGIIKICDELKKKTQCVIDRGSNVDDEQ